MTVDPGPTAIGSGHSSMAEDAVHEPTMKFHQRLTQSLSLRTSNQASSLQRGTSFTLPDKLRRPSFHLLRRPSQATSSAGSAAAAAAAAATSSMEQPLSPRSGRPPLHLDKELPVPPPRSAARRAEKVEEEEQDDDDDDEIEDEDDVEDDDDDVVPRPASSASSTSTPSTPSSEPQNRFETVDEWLEAYFGDHTKNTQPRNVHAAKDTLTQLLSAMDDHTHPSSSLLLSLKDHVNRVDVHTGEKDPLQVLQGIALALTPQPNLTPEAIEPFVHEFPQQNASLDFQALWPDHVAPHTSWFADYFKGNEYTTLLARHKAAPGANKTPTTLISAILLDFLPEPAFCLILRHTHMPAQRQMVPVTSAQAYTWAKVGKTRRSLVRSQSSATFAPHVHEDDRLLAAAVMLVCPDIEITRASRVPFHAVLESELEAKIHRLDATESPTCYKFGALTVRPGQTREQDWIGNTGVTPAFDTFLNHLGRRILLQYYRGYSGGLDTYTNETGETSVVASWQDFEMMFHVPALMPFRENDAQHVHRKRYLGNDIVCVVFLDGADVVFDPCAIKSRFLHVYILVRPVEPQGWRVEVVHKASVPEFGPALPSPPIFEDPVVLHQFLMVKLINAENAALKSAAFAGNVRARGDLLANLIDVGLAQPGVSLLIPEEPRLSLRASMSKRRPKSSTASRESRGSRLSRTSMGSIRSTPDTRTPRSPTFEDVPPLPIPSPTRSTMLQDLKNFALRRTVTLTQRPFSSGMAHEDASNAAYTTQSLSAASSAAKLRASAGPTPSNDPNAPNSDTQHAPGLSHRSILAAKARAALFKTPPSGIAAAYDDPSMLMDADLPEPQATASRALGYDSFRSKAQNLMINVVPKRTKPTIPVLNEDT